MNMDSQPWQVFNAKNKTLIGKTCGLTEWRHPNGSTPGQGTPRSP